MCRTLKQTARLEDGPWPSSRSARLYFRPHRASVSSRKPVPVRSLRPWERCAACHVVGSALTLAFRTRRRRSAIGGDPRPRAPWAPVTLNATVPPPICAQGTGSAPAGSEDCLTLNIWTPAAGPPRRPVIVWLHFGDFRATSSNSAASDGLRFASEQNVVVVAPNYRLGPFGFLAHSALSLENPSYTSSGNYGLADQRAALRWIRDHIAAFGGDPDNVTLFGQSAGAVSTSRHLVSPASRGPFPRAILQSGQASARWTTSSEAEGQGDAFAAPASSDRQRYFGGALRNAVCAAQAVRAQSDGTS
jgi:carboxylesterase type B